MWPFNFKYPHTEYHARQENSEYPYTDYHIIDLNWFVEQIKSLWDYVAEHIVEFPLSIGKGGTGATSTESARTNLGLGALATLDRANISHGGTGATTAAGARTNLGLGAVATENIVPVSKGGTGADNAADARVNLGIEETTVSFPITLAKGGTGVEATSIQDLWNRIKVFGLERGVSVGSGASLANVTTPGNYIFFANNQDLPVSGEQGNLIVFKIDETNNRVMQLAIQNGVVSYRFGRVNTTTVWSVWKQFLDSESIIPVTKGGTGATTAQNARSNLGLGAVATENVLPIAKGGTGATTAANARSNLELESGTNNGWTYFRIGSNVIAWYYRQQTGIAITSSWNGIYFRSSEIEAAPYPSFLQSGYKFGAFLAGGSQSGGVTLGRIMDDNGALRAYLIGTQSISNASCAIMVVAIGEWND